ncbi:MAG: helix-turn-helix transcriptional regulator [Clostridia bacterium]|nr:helix-turn-helix transcriptional regulator [Clostridia bacterium]
MEIGKRIFEQRTQKGLTMEQLANLLGVQKSAVNKWEKGIVKNIKRPTILKMSEIFGCEPSYLMGFDQAMQNKWHNEVLSSIQENISGMQNVVNLSDDEYVLIENYRNSSEVDKEAAKRLLAYASKMRKQK